MLQYPYLGVKTVGNHDVVVFFGKDDNDNVVGSVVIGIEGNKEYAFGRVATFDEDEFDFLAGGIPVRLEN